MNDNSIYPWNRSLTNSVLIKDELGKSKQTTFNLPGEEFAYGKALNRDMEGAKEVSLTWKYHMPTHDIRSERDFKKLNKMAITNKLHRSEQYQDFRKSNDARVKVNKGKNMVEMELPDDNFRYGKPNPLSTPVKLLMGNAFGNEASENQKYKYSRVTSAKTYNGYQTLNQFKSTKHTNATSIYKTAIKAQLEQRSRIDEEPFKLSKFKNVAGKTNTIIRPSSAQPSKQFNQKQNYSEQYRIPTQSELAQ